MGTAPLALSAVWQVRPVVDNCLVDYLAIGEWVTSNVLFSAAFLVAGLGIVGIASWVLRADRINRAAIDATVETDAEHLGH